MSDHPDERRSHTPDFGLLATTASAGSLLHGCVWSVLAAQHYREQYHDSLYDLSVSAVATVEFARGLAVGAIVATILWSLATVIRLVFPRIPLRFPLVLLTAFPLYAGQWALEAGRILSLSSFSPGSLLATLLPLRSLGTVNGLALVSLGATVGTGLLGELLRRRLWRGSAGLAALLLSAVCFAS